MKPNLKIMLPTLLVIVAVQFFLVRYFVGNTNEATEKVIGTVDTTIPHPNTRYDAKEVVKVVLYSLKLNDLPVADSGIKTFWQFMSPRFKDQIRDKALIAPYLKEEVLISMKDYEAYDFIKESENDNEAIFDVEFKSSQRLTQKVRFELLKIEGLWLIEKCHSL